MLEDMGASQTKQKAPSPQGKTKKATPPGPGPVPPLPYLLPPGFTEADRHAVRYYTSDEGYKTMNPYLRSPDGYTPEAAAEIQKRSDRVSAALAKLPPQPGMTYRTANLSDDVLENYAVGKVVTERAFTSTSSDMRILMKKSFEGNTIMTIEGKSGRDISKSSLYEHEQEILYDKGTQFLVTGKIWSSQYNKWFIQLEEV